MSESWRKLTKNSREIGIFVKLLKNFFHVDKYGLYCYFNRVDSSIKYWKKDCSDCLKNFVTEIK